MKFRLLLAFTSVLLLLLSACSPKHSEIVVADYGKYNITLNDFEEAYAKNVGGIEEAKADSINDYKNFLDLYVNFKMKLRDAEVRGLQTDPSLVNEMEDYKKKVGFEYIREKLIIEKGLKDLYERRREEIRVSHIMIRPDTMSMDQAKELAASLIERIKNGESFEELAKKYSSDNFSKDIGGDIYYITAGQVIAPFEMAAYATPVGEIYPEPIQTRFGYHVLKVTERQERRYQLRAKHILVNFSNPDGQFDSVYALNKINSIRDSIINGASFDELAKRHSDDKGSGVNGGDLGFFERRSMVKEFDEAVFNMKMNEVSDVVKTQYGYHIIKLVDENPYPSYENSVTALKHIYERTTMDSDLSAYLDSLKVKYNYVQNDEAVNKIVSRKDTTKFGEDYKGSSLRNEMKDEWIIKVDNKPYTVDSMMTYAGNQKNMVNMVLSESSLNNALQLFSDRIIYEKAALDLENTDQKFAGLMEDYQNGLFIFRLQEDEVWNKISVDTTKLYQLYEETKDNYQLPPRVSFTEIYSVNDSLINQYYQDLKNGSDFEVLASKVTERPGMKSKAGRYDMVPLTNNQVANIAYQLENKGDYSKPTQVGNAWVIVKLNEKDAARLKTFEEAKAEVSSLYQEKESKRLEAEYLERLKAIYNPVVYYDELEKAFEPEED
jgi:peptidyl-prolyl cis-trans isomerase SurA